MYIIKNFIKDEQIIKNSRFITCLFPISSKEEVNSILEQVKLDYPKATHYCYAYVTLESKKASDDGEPGGTAGMPILGVLEKESMMNILAIVVRYFGGVKLGASGLVRAYSKSITEALKKAFYLELLPGKLVTVEIDYSSQKQLDYILKDKNYKKEFTDKVIYFIEIEKNEINSLEQYNYEVVKDILIKKEIKK